MTLAAAIRQLHDRCAIYTSAPTAARLLDTIGWVAGADLSASVLLEPCVGEGAILLEGVRRLLRSMRDRGQPTDLAGLMPRVRGFEIHPPAARAARRALRRALVEEGVAWAVAGTLAEAWVIERDFLLEEPAHASHVAANPPYVRWSKLPSELAVLYRDKLPAAATRGDVSVAFLYCMQQWADNGGAIVALVSDRWMYAQYGDEFVASTRTRGWMIDVTDERPHDAFVREVGAYSAIVLLTRAQGTPDRRPANSRLSAQNIHRGLVERYGTLTSAGCRVKVGPALGAGRTFIVEAGATVDVEPELVRSFVQRKDLVGIEVAEPRLRVVVPYDRAGKAIDPADWPRFARWAAEREEVLRARSQFKSSDRYWRTIDAVPAEWSETPRLLLPELCTRPTPVIDRTGAIPAHSLYAIWPGEWPPEILRAVLDAGLLELTARAEAPRLKMGWMRFYKRFLVRTPLPRWSDLSDDHRTALAQKDHDFDEAFRSLFDFAPGAVPIS